MPAGAPPWLPGGPYHVSHPSLRSENGVQFGGWAMEWTRRRTECLWWPFPSIQASRVAGQAAF